MSSRRIIALSIIAAALAAGIGAWLAAGRTGGDQPRQPTAYPDDRPLRVAERTARPADSLAGSSSAAASLPPLQQELKSLAEPERNAVFQLALDDSTFDCGQVLHSVAVSDEPALWHVACGDLTNFWLSIGLRGRIAIEPIPDSEPMPAPIVRIPTEP